MQSRIIILTLTALMVCLQAQSAPFGSVPLDSPPTQPTFETPKVEAPAVSPQVQTAPAPAETVAPAQEPAPSAPLPSSLTVDGTRKWVQDQKGLRYMVPTEAELPPGWSEVPAPATMPEAAAAAPMAPADEVWAGPAAPTAEASPPAQPQIETPQTYQSVPQTYSQQQQPAPQTYPSAPQTYPQQPQPYPAPALQQPAYSAPPTSTGIPPGKKKLRHSSGYIVIVDQSAIPGPDFTEVETSAPAQPTQPQTYGGAPPQTYPAPAAQPYSPLPPVGAGAQGSPQMPSYQQIASQAQANTYQQPQTYNTSPQVPHIPPTWQQQLPYQPPRPQYQQPTGVPGQVPYGVQGQPSAPVPVVRSTPPGKKWVADQNGMRYLVSEDTIIVEGSGMREVTEEELNRPMMMMPQQQQQQQGSAIGRFFQRMSGGR